MLDIQEVIHNNISEHGWHAQCVLGDDNFPEFTYSIGWGVTRDWPEVIVLGQRSEVAHGMLVRIWEENPIPADGSVRSDVLDGFECHLRSVDLSWYRFLFGSAIDYYTERNLPPFRVLQCVWPTTSGILPWDTGAPDWFEQAQPLVFNKMEAEPG